MNRTPRNRTSSICIHDNKLLSFRGVDPLSGTNYILPPGGEVERGETIEECVIRETLEETGFATRLLPLAPVVKRYDFTWNGTLYDCTTTFFNVELIDPKAEPQQVDDQDYNKETVWLPLAEIDTAMAFSQPILDGVRECLLQYSQKKVPGT